MKIKSIDIKNIKGIKDRTFNLELISNKPNLLVAPNGFGKSSFGIAFESLKSNKLDLDEHNYHDSNLKNLPELKICVEDSGIIKTYNANNSSNTISENFDVFVINSQLVSKAKIMKIAGKTIPKSTLEIATSTLIPTIPEKVTFGYSFTDLKKSFGINGKILPDISAVFSKGNILSIIEKEISFKKFTQVKISQKIASLKSEINKVKGTIEQIRNWIRDEKLKELRSIDELNKLANILNTCDLSNINDETNSYLAAFQIISIYQSKGSNFKKACKYQYYLRDKEEYKEIIRSFNSTRFNIKPKEDKKKGLIVEWPKAHEISNGQRDVLSFIVLILKARRSFKKNNCILIIDEVFDYLDDANLISFQYFVTNFIEYMKQKGVNFFPVIMTHLDPMFFNHFCFNKHKIKVHYLKEVSAKENPQLLKLIRLRENISIKNGVDKYYFHFHPEGINLMDEFRALGIEVGWAESNKFHIYVQKEVEKYLNNLNDYDPLAICFGVRVRIEELLYKQITDPEKQKNFIDEHGTKNKLKLCEEIGLDVPEIYYLLGIIYNDNLHWHNGVNLARPIAIKLENITIKRLVNEIFKG